MRALPLPPVVIELPGEILSATVDIALGRATPVIQVRSQPVEYSPVVIGTPSRPLTVTLRARNRSQVRGPPVVHEVATSTPTAFQQVMYGRSDEERVGPNTLPRPQASGTGSFLIHSPQPISVPIARHLEEDLVNQVAQRMRDAIISRFLEEQRTAVPSATPCAMAVARAARAMSALCSSMNENQCRKLPRKLNVAIRRWRAFIELCLMNTPHT